MHCYENSGSRSRWSRIVSSYLLEDKWNILDFVTIWIYLISFVTRFFVIEQAFIVSK
jgi:hypothetical protein